MSSILKTVVSYILSSLLVVSGERENPVPGLVQSQDVTPSWQEAEVYIVP